MNNDNDVYVFCLFKSVGRKSGLVLCVVWLLEGQACAER